MVLIEMGHTQTPTPSVMDIATVEGFVMITPTRNVQEPSICDFTGSETG